MAAALLLRLAVAWQLAEYNQGRNAVFAPSVQTDLATYMRLAGEVAAGEFAGEFDYQPFYYAVFLAGLRLVFGASVWAVIAVQALLGAAAVGLTALTARRLAGRAAGVCAAGLVLFSSALVLYTPFHAIVTLMSFWVILTLYLTIRAAAERDWRWFLAAGLAAGCAVLTRGNFYIVAPALLAAAWCRAPEARRRWPRRVCQVLLVLLALFAVQIPFIWRNTLVKGEFTGASTGSGKVLALANTPAAPPGGRNPGLPAGPMEYPPTWHSWMATEAGVSIPRRILDWAVDEPGAFLELNFRKALLFWDYREIPNNIAFHIDPELGLGMVGEADQAPLLRLAFVPTGVILALGLAGIFLGLRHWLRRRSWVAWLALYWVAAYWFATAVFYILARFRAPLLPVLAVFGGMFVAWLWRFRRRGVRGRRGWAAPALALAAAVFIVYGAYGFYSGNLEARVLRAIASNGVHVTMADGREMRLDHGPASFGDWQGLPLERGVVVAKGFAGVPEYLPEAVLELSIQVIRPGRLTLEIGGKSVVLSFAQRGMFVREVLLAGVRGGEVEFRVAAVSGEMYLTCDLRRDYGRTRVGGAEFGGEAVIRLYFPPPK